MRMWTYFLEFALDCIKIPIYFSKYDNVRRKELIKIYFTYDEN